MIRYDLGLPISVVTVGMGVIEQIKQNIALAWLRPLAQPERKKLKEAMA